MHVPGWHYPTQKMRDEGAFRMAGIVQEQHPDRVRLFAQWHRIDWPILVDAFNELDVSLVPITVLIDEHGIVRRIVPRGAAVRDELTAFLDQRFEPPPARESSPPAKTSVAFAPGAPTPLDTPSRLVDRLAALVAERPDDGRASFALGTAYRMRHDSDERVAGDFQKAVDAWNRALEIDPNNYIWRRRLEQYGPRPLKPYPFYDWIELARRAAAERGETPVALSVEPGPAETAQPSTRFDVAETPAVEPDPRGRVHRDREGLVRVDAAVVTLGRRAGGTARVYLDFRPSPTAHWNNEARGLILWIDPPAGWQVENRRLELTNPPAPLSSEARSLEFEVRHDGVTDAPAMLKGYALYYACQGRDGPCLYRRQDVALALPAPTSSAGKKRR